MSDLVPIIPKRWEGVKPVTDRKAVADALNTYHDMVARAQGVRVAEAGARSRFFRLAEARDRAIAERRMNIADRNQRIRDLYAVGITPAMLAERFRLNRDYVYAILQVRPEAG